MKFNIEVKHEPTGNLSKLSFYVKGPKSTIEAIEAAIHSAAAKDIVSAPATAEELAEKWGK